jgi:hypothetical protein
MTQQKLKYELTLDDINARINDEICNDAILQLTDEQLMGDYIKCNSVNNEIAKLSTILQKYVTNKVKQQIIQEYSLHLIPAGTKGVIRGIKFNAIVKMHITNLKLDETLFEICFEKMCDIHVTSEKPDWFIRNIKTGKTIIGMNQLDLWRGGQQINRGFKYLENNIHNTDTCKLLCVICNKIQLKKETNKVFKLFKIGFENDTLCYLNNLSNIINDFLCN